MTIKTSLVKSSMFMMAIIMYIVLKPIIFIVELAIKTFSRKEFN